MAEPLRVMVVGAHPDDIEFTCAGSVAKWISEGAEVSYVLATKGEYGTQSVGHDPRAFGLLREVEATEAAKRVGVTDIRFLGFIDSKVEYNDALRKAIAREFRSIKPQRLVCMSPDQVLGSAFINHPDHRFVAQATLDVFLAFGCTGGIYPELDMDEGLPAWVECKEAWIAGPGQDGEAVDITDHLDAKILAISAHASQDPDGMLAFVREHAARMGEVHGFGAAETFTVVKKR